MYKIVFTFLLLQGLLIANSLTIIITDSYIQNDKVKKETVEFFKKKLHAQHKGDKIIVYDIAKNQALIVLENAYTRSNQKIFVKKFRSYISWGSKKNLKEKHFAKALQNAIDYINGSHYQENNIYVFGAFYENSGNVDLKKGYPSDGCLSSTALNDFISINKVNKEAKIHFFYKKLKQEREYARFFYYLSKRVGLDFYSFNRKFHVQKYEQNYAPFRKNETICKMHKKVVEKINLNPDECKLLSSGETIHFKCSNPLRKNTQVTYKHNNHTYETTVNKYGEFDIYVKTVNGRNSIELMSLENKYKTIYVGDFLYKSKDKLKCQLKNDKIALISGSNSDRELNAKVTIIYDGQTFTGYTNNNKAFAIEIPIHKKMNRFEVVQPDGGSEYCSLEAKNMVEQKNKQSDILRVDVKNGLAKVWVNNPDRHKGEDITYKYNDYNAVQRKLEASRDGRLYFIVPLELNAVTHRITTDRGGYVDISNPKKTGYVRVVLRWLCPGVDLDMYVTEPDGYELASLHADKRKHYGKINLDSLLPKNGPEVYTLNLAHAPKGIYKVHVRFYSDLKPEFCKRGCTGIIEINNNGKTRIETVIFDPLVCKNNKPLRKTKRIYPASPDQYFKFRVGE